jgi:hypothetical protein
MTEIQLFLLQVTYGADPIYERTFGKGRGNLLLQASLIYNGLFSGS